jgi:hypothetical protein
MQLPCSFMLSKELLYQWCIFRRSVTIHHYMTVLSDYNVSVSVVLTSQDGSPAMLLLQIAGS